MADDFLQVIKNDVVSEQLVAADLKDLTCGKDSGRQIYDEKALFKSVDAALEDLATARLVFYTIARLSVYSRDFVGFNRDKLLD